MAHPGSWFRHRRLLPAVAIVAFSASCLSSCNTMPIAAPMISPGEIPVRNEIAREWRVFTSNVAENRLEEAWAGLSARLQKGPFENDPDVFHAWVTRERDGLLKGVSGSWLYQLHISTFTAKAKPEGMDALREVRFVKERGRWRIDNWGAVPTL